MTAEREREHSIIDDIDYRKMPLLHVHTRLEPVPSIIGEAIINRRFDYVLINYRILWVNSEMSNELVRVDVILTKLLHNFERDYNSIIIF